MSRQVLVSQLKEYFASKGRTLTAEEYREAEDAPIRYQVLKRKLGSWPRILNMVGEIKAVVVPEPPAPPAPKATPKAKEVEKPVGDA